MPFKSLLVLSIPAAAVAVLAASPDAARRYGLELENLPGLSKLAGQSKTEQSLFTYQTGALSNGTVRRRVQTSGTVRPLVTVQVGSQLSGQIKQVLTDFNAPVKEGDVMAILDDKTFAARVDQAAADLATAEAELVSQTAALEKVEANLRQAERANDRLQALSDKGITAKATADTATRDADVAKAEIAVTKAQIDVAKGRLLNKRAALRQAEIDLVRTQIRAPMDGTVISRTVEVGQTVAASLSAPELFRIAQDLKKIIIEAQVSESDIGGIEAGDPVTFHVDAYRDKAFKGKVNQVRLAGNEERGVVSYTVVVEAANDDLKLYPGMTATVEIELDKRSEVARIPAEALRYKPVDQAKETAESKSARRQEKLEELTETLGLSDEQTKIARKALEDLAVQEEAAANAKKQGHSDTKKNFSSTEAIELALKSSFSPEQTARFAEWKSGRLASRRAQVWVVGGSGKPEARTLRIGLVDDKFAEVLAANKLKPEDQIILRSSLVRSAQQ